MVKLEIKVEFKNGNVNITNHQTDATMKQAHKMIVADGSTEIISYSDEKLVCKKCFDEYNATYTFYKD